MEPILRKNHILFPNDSSKLYFRQIESDSGGTIVITFIRRFGNGFLCLTSDKRIGMLEKRGGSSKKERSDTVPLKRRKGEDDASLVPCQFSFLGMMRNYQNEQWMFLEYDTDGLAFFPNRFYRETDKRFVFCCNNKVAVVSIQGQRITNIVTAELPECVSSVGFCSSLSKEFFGFIFSGLYDHQFLVGTEAGKLYSLSIQKENIHIREILDLQSVIMSIDIYGSEFIIVVSSKKFAIVKMMTTKFAKPLILPHVICFPSEIKKSVVITDRIVFQDINNFIFIAHIPDEKNSEMKIMQQPFCAVDDFELCENEENLVILQKGELKNVPLMSNKILNEYNKKSITKHCVQASITDALEKLSKLSASYRTCEGENQYLSRTIQELNLVSCIARRMYNNSSFECTVKGILSENKKTFIEYAIKNVGTVNISNWSLILYIQSNFGRSFSIPIVSLPINETLTDKIPIDLSTLDEFDVGIFLVYATEQLNDGFGMESYSTRLNVLSFIRPTNNASSGRDGNFCTKNLVDNIDSILDSYQKQKKFHTLRLQVSCETYEKYLENIPPLFVTHQNVTVQFRKSKIANRDSMVVFFQSEDQETLSAIRASLTKQRSSNKKSEQSEDLIKQILEATESHDHTLEQLRNSVHKLITREKNGHNKDILFSTLNDQVQKLLFQTKSAYLNHRKSLESIPLSI